MDALFLMKSNQYYKLATLTKVNKSLDNNCRHATPYKRVLIENVNKSEYLKNSVFAIIFRLNFPQTTRSVPQTVEIYMIAE